MLTRKQYELLVFIEKGLRETGISPSYDEMKDALALRSKSGIHRLITGLEERGFIRRLPHRARALEVLRLPENMDAPAPAGGFSPNVIKGEFKLPGTRASADTEMVELPFYGRIAAGTPIDLPLGHMDLAWSFDHFDTITVMIADAPRADEIVLCMGVADGGRPYPRVGSKPITD